MGILIEFSVLQHTSLLHVVDARTFETEEIVRMPSFESPTMYHPPSAARPRSTSPAPRPSTTRSSSSSDPLAPPRIVLFSGALEDTFRIPTTRHARRRFSRSREDVDTEDDAEMVVIPPLGDREVENDVRRLLGRHANKSSMLEEKRDGERRNCKTPEG